MSDGLQRAIELQRELVHLLDALSRDPMKQCSELLYLRSLAAELALRVERCTGELLRSLPDRGGRPRKSNRAPMPRRVRGALGLDRDEAMRLRRYAELPVEAFELHVDECWPDVGWPRVQAVSGVVRDVAKPPASVGDGE